MDKVNDVYRCNVCGHVVEVMRASPGQLVCCGQPMELLKENSVDASKEKHVPVIEKTKEGFKVKIGSVPHPMEEKHFIEWIELIADGVSYKKFLHPGDKPEAEFCIKAKAVNARELCNLHGLWKA